MCIRDSSSGLTYNSTNDRVEANISGNAAGNAAAATTLNAAVSINTLTSGTLAEARLPNTIAKNVVEGADNATLTVNTDNNNGAVTITSNATANTGTLTDVNGTGNVTVNDSGNTRIVSANDNRNATALTGAIVASGNITGNLNQNTNGNAGGLDADAVTCLLYTSPSPRD